MRGQVKISLKKTPKRIGFAIKATQSCLHFIHILKFCAQSFNGVSHKDCKDYVTIRENFKQFNILVAEIYKPSSA